MTHQVSSFPFTLGILQSNASKTRSLFLNNSFLLLHISGGCQGRPRHYFVGTMNEKGSFKAVGMGKTISFCSGRRGEGGKEWDSYLCPPLKNIFIACSRARFCTTQTCTEIQNVTFFFFFFVCLFHRLRSHWLISNTIRTATRSSLDYCAHHITSSDVALL
uniref:Uncharacterized protein n=1 Tax=Trypanosoma vivax (strain Y486) TaxID=1055687 RepID=G0TZX5_TRYVY|nr:hypothetical protein TVY486_0807620 [Trypanosoma vivax Y486]